MDDKVPVLTITGYQKYENKLPEIGDIITRKYQDNIGIAFDYDQHGYAILHTAKPLPGPLMKSKCRVDKIVEEDASVLYASEYRKVTLHTTVVYTALAYIE